MKIVLNGCYGGFGVSAEAVRRMRELGSEDANKTDIRIGDYDSYSNFKRDDPILVKVVEELGKRANGRGANLKILEIDVENLFTNYDGKESLI